MAEKKAMNPYLAGALSGVLASVSLLITGKYFGASTTFVRVAGMIEKVFAPQRVASMDYFIKEAPKIEWQWMFVAGIALGALISSLLAKDFKVVRVPETWRKRYGDSALKRGLAAFIGGIIAIFGVRLASGCPSGHGLSGVMQLAVSGFVALFCFFIGGVVTAKLIYKEGRAK